MLFWLILVTIFKHDVFMSSIAHSQESKISDTASLLAIRLQPIQFYIQISQASERGLLFKRRKSHVFEDSISMELMSKLPVSHAGDAIRRVTGISIVGGKYVYVRGLGQRYSNTLLNEVEIPSPEANRRIVPMDIFPASLLKSLKTIKTFSPDQPGNFAGGSVQITTKDFPETQAVSLSMSSSYNSNSTGHEILSYDGGAIDYLGFDDGSRKMPELIDRKAKKMPIREKGMFGGYGFTSQEIAEFGRTFENVWTPYRRKAPANQSYKLSFGNTSRFLGKELGYLGIISYGGSNKNKSEKRSTFRMSLDNNLTPVTSYEAERSQNEVSWGGVGNLSINLSKAHRIGLKTIYSRSAEDEARTWQGYNSDRGTDLRSSRLRYVARGLFSSQLSGQHNFGFVELNDDAPISQSRLVWRLAFSRAVRSEPDTREMVYEKYDDGWYFRDITQSGSRFFFNLVDNEISTRIDWNYQFNVQVSIKTGILLRNRSRDFDARRFRFQPSDNINKFIDLRQPGELLFTPVNIKPSLFELRESTRNTDNYDASSKVVAGYTMVDTPIFVQKLRLISGIRLEMRKQEVTTFDPFSPTMIPIIADLQMRDILPSFNMVYQFSRQMNLRLAVSKTLTLPDLREMAPFEFTDFVGGHTIFGNPNLKHTKINNYDVRWEVFPASGGVVAISGFDKKFTDAIEKIVQPQTEVRVTYENANMARNRGVELEIRRSFELVHESLSGLSINANAAYIWSKVVLPNIGIQTSSNRALQGQSPYVVNATLGYENANLGFSSTLTYHTFGKRIAEVGSHKMPDVYELPRDHLGLSCSRKMGDNIILSFSAKNLLNNDVTFRQGNKTYLCYDTGRSYSFNLTYNL